jgi:hypothetical protein
MESPQGIAAPSRRAVALDAVTIDFQLAGGGVYPAVEKVTLGVDDGEFVACSMSRPDC